MISKFPMSTRLLGLSAGAVLAALPLAVASAQQPTPEGAASNVTATVTPTPDATTSTSSTEKKSWTGKESVMVKKFGAGNAAEVKLGQLALSNGESQDVKDFATKMIKDHGDANTDLGTIAEAHKIEFPPAETPKQKEVYERLSKLKGAAFDKAYAKDAVKDHTMDFEEYKMASESVKDAEFKTYVDKTKDVVEEHLKMAKEMESKVGAKS